MEIEKRETSSGYGYGNGTEDGMSKKWKPKKGETFWWFDFNGRVFQRTYRDEGFDFNFVAFGNMFKTEEEAEAAVEKIKALLLSLQEVKEEKKTVFPKLTAEVFDRPDCPKWAKYAAVDKCGYVRLFSHSPWLSESCWNWANGEVTQLFGVTFDASDWQKSLIKRPEPEFPEWCQKGKWVCVYDRFKKEWEYFKVNETKRNCISSCNGLEYSFCDLKQARVRPWTFEEAPVVLKVKDTYDFALAYLSPFGGKYVIAYHHPDEYEKLKLGEVTFTFSAFADIFTQIDGSPCGVLEHLNENLEWEE